MSTKSKSGKDVKTTTLSTANEAQGVVRVAPILIPKTKAEVATTIKQLEDLRDQLKGNTDKTVKTDISWDISVSETSIKNITTLTELVILHGTLKSTKAKFDESVKELDLQDSIKPFNVNGVTYEDFMAAIKKRTYEIRNEARLKQVEESIKEMQNFLSEEEKQKIAMQRIVESASSLLQ